MELVRLQEDSAGKLEARKVEVQAQIEAERRATEQYRVRGSRPPPLHPSLPHVCTNVCSNGVASSQEGPEGWVMARASKACCKGSVSSMQGA